MIRNKLIYITNWAMGIAGSFIGVVNIFYGNDAFFGVFLLVLSLIFIPELTKLIQYKFAISIPLWVKIAIALFIFWSSVGVGELFDKIDLMMQSFR